MKLEAAEKQVAEKAGYNALAVYQYLNDWCSYNKRNKRNYVRGRYWTYGTLREISAKMPGMTVSKLRTSLKKLKEIGAIQTGNFNKWACDRTVWYTTNSLEKIIKHDKQKGGEETEVNNKLKSIETWYNGIKFRSRLEARWAVFFDALGVKYEYEPEGFELGDGTRYLPDFRVKCWGTRGTLEDEPFDLYIEVKGNMTEQDADKLDGFIDFDVVKNGEESWRVDIANKVLIVNKIPAYGHATDSKECGSYDDMSDGRGMYPFNYNTIDGDCFAAYPAATRDGKFYLFGDDSNYIDDNVVRVEYAYTQARSARFEWGETPAPEELRDIVNRLEYEHYNRTK